MSSAPMTLGYPPPSPTAPVGLITGASSGIGRAIAVGLSDLGVRLCLAGRRTAQLAETAQATRKLAKPALIYSTDLSSDEDIHALASAVAQDAGSLDILVHSAGAMTLGSAESARLADFDALYRVNVRAPYLLTQLLLPLLRERRGQVVFINSSTGLDARANVGQYAATKHALRAVADALREEVNKDGIRVSSIYVGRTATPMQAAVHEAEGRPYLPERLLQPEDVAAAVTSVICLSQTAEVTDLQIRPMLAPSPEAYRS